MARFQFGTDAEPRFAQIDLDLEAPRTHQHGSRPTDRRTLVGRSESAVVGVCGRWYLHAHAVVQPAPLPDQVLAGEPAWGFFARANCARSPATYVLPKQQGRQRQLQESSNCLRKTGAGDPT
jgi:hypothetical protein